MNRIPRNFVNFSAAAGYNVKNRAKAHGKGGRRFRQPPVSPDFRTSRPPQGLRAPSRRRQCPIRAGKGCGPERFGRRLTNVFPRPVTGAGAIPRDQLPTSMSFAPPLPCGIGFAGWSSRVADPEGSPCLDARPVRFAPKSSHFPNIWSSGLAGAEAPACPDNPLRPCPKAPASRLVAWLVHAPGEHFPPWRPAFPMPKHRRDVLDTGSVSFPSHPLSRAGRAVSRGGVPVSSCTSSRRHLCVSIRCKLLISL